MLELREKITCCFTGHRILSKDELLLINRTLREVIRDRINEGGLRQAEPWDLTPLPL